MVRSGLGQGDALSGGAPAMARTAIAFERMTPGSRLRGRPAGMLVMVVLGVAIVRGTLGIVLPGMPGLLRHHVADDGFYYFDLARHFPRPIASAGIQTTGFHPLYWAVIGVPFHLLSSAPAIRIALLLLLACHVAVGIAIARLAWGPLGRWPATVCSAGWMASPYLRQVALTGVETPLAILAIVALAALAKGGSWDVRRGVACGVVCGIAGLARTDAVVVAAFIVADALWSAWRSGRTHRQVFGPGLACAGAAVLVASPWLGWLATHGGLQDSARALRLLRQHGVTVGATGWLAVSRQVAGSIVSGLLPGRAPSAAARGLAAIALVFIGVLGTRSAAGRGWYSRWRGVLLGVVVLEALYATILGGTRIWYQLYAALVVWLVVLPAGASTVLAWLSDHPPRVRQVAGAVVALGLAGLALGREPLLNPQEPDKYFAATTLPAVVERGARIGAFNSGVYTFFSAYPVVNLDGVVNPTVQPALAHRALCRYLRQRRVDWFLDASAEFDEFRLFAPGVRLTSTTDLGRLYGARDPYPILDHEILARLDTSAC